MRRYLLVFVNEFSAVKMVHTDEHELATVLRIDPYIVIGKIAGPDLL